MATGVGGAAEPPDTESFGAALVDALGEDIKKGAGVSFFTRVDSGAGGEGSEGASGVVRKTVEMAC